MDFKYLDIKLKTFYFSEKIQQLDIIISNYDFKVLLLCEPNTKRLKRNIMKQFL